MVAPPPCFSTCMVTSIFVEIEKYGEKPVQHIPRQADQGQRQGGFSI